MPSRNGIYKLLCDFSTKKKRRHYGRLLIANVLSLPGEFVRENHHTILLREILTKTALQGVPCLAHGSVKEPCGVLICGLEELTLLLSQAAGTQLCINPPAVPCPEDVRLSYFVTLLTLCTFKKRRKGTVYALRAVADKDDASALPHNTLLPHLQRPRGLAGRL